MKAKVSTLYRNGRRLPRNKSGKTVVGDLNLHVSKHPVTGLCCKEAVVFLGNGLQPLAAMFDVECIVIAADGLLLRGFEMVSGREVAQEWWCKPMAEKIWRV